VTTSQSPLPPLADSYEGLLNRARASRQGGNVADAIALYQRLTGKLKGLSDRLLERRPDLRDLHLQARLELVDLLRQEGRYTEAIEAEGVLLDTHPEQADVWRTDLAVLRVAQGHVEEGLADLQALAEKELHDPWRWLVLGREARIEGRFGESQAALDQALEAVAEDNPRDQAQIEYQRFQLFREMGQIDDALAAWEKASSHDPEVGKTIKEVYTMLTDAGRYSEARRYVDRDENALQAGLQRGLILSLTGGIYEAREEWRKVADQDPHKFQGGHDAWVESVLRLGDPVPALEWLQNHLASYPTPRMFVLSGIGWAMYGDSDLAAKLFQQAISFLRHSRPAQQKLSSADWRLLDSLVADKQMKTDLKPYFAVVETIWGQ
jgi:tetratricopeptide (TPR) repeat protein